MLLKKTMQKTKKLFMKGLQNLKKFLFGSYENIPKTLFLNPLSCTSINQRTHHLDHIYPEFSSSNQSSPSDHNQNNHDHTMKHIITIDATTSCEITDETKHKVAKPPRKIHPSNPTTSFRHSNCETKTCTTTTTTQYNPTEVGSTKTCTLAQKMKELEMMDIRDVDHTLDVEEALHYYSRLTCPEYVDMVNKFFTDMYSDFNVPQPSMSKSSSSRRLGPLTPQPSIRISSSSKRLESTLTRQPSIRVSSSSRRLDSVVTPQPSTRINSSSRRLGPLTLCLD